MAGPYSLRRGQRCYAHLPGRKNSVRETEVVMDRGKRHWLLVAGRRGWTLGKDERGVWEWAAVLSV